MGQGILILEKLSVPKRSLGEFKTDSIALRVPKQKREAIKKEIGDVRYCDLHALKDTYMPISKNQRRLDDTIPLIPIASDEPVYRIHDMEEQDKMMGCLAPFPGVD